MTRQEARDKALAAIDRLATCTHAHQHAAGIAMARSVVASAYADVRETTREGVDRFIRSVESEAGIARLAAEVCGPYNPAKALDARKPDTAACPLWRTA